MVRWHSSGFVFVIAAKLVSLVMSRIFLKNEEFHASVSVGSFPLMSVGRALSLRLLLAFVSSPPVLNTLKVVLKITHTIW